MFLRIRFFPSWTEEIWLLCKFCIACWTLKFFVFLMNSFRMSCDNCFCCRLYFGNLIAIIRFVFSAMVYLHIFDDIGVLENWKRKYLQIHINNLRKKCFFGATLKHLSIFIHQIDVPQHGHSYLDSIFLKQIKRRVILLWFKLTTI